MAHPLDWAFTRVRQGGQRAFIPFLTAGDPDLTATQSAIREFSRRGVTAIEIGIPYSDPIADGPVIQASYTRALQRGLKLCDVFRCTRELATEPDIAPLVAMISFAIIHRFGAERFVADAVRSGFCGAIVPDLPVDESEPLAQLAASRDFKLIQLVTPTTPRDRAVRIAQASTGFIYFVSITGITGERRDVPTEIIESIQWLKTQTKLPICVGFGISQPEQVRQLAAVADGVIVGSAIVRRIAAAGAGPTADVIAAAGEYVQSLLHACADF